MKEEKKKKGKRGFFGPRQRCSGVISIAGYTLWNGDNRVVSSQYSGVWLFYLELRLVWS